MMRNAATIAAAHARASRIALATLASLSAFAFVVTVATVTERHQARTDRIMQEVRP